MVRAEFEEREFEFAANLELAEADVAGRRGVVFPTGQVLEAILGYDGATAPVTTHRVWALLKRPRPKGVVLSPEMWAPGRRPPAGRLPRHPVSLFIQYKRPEYLRGTRAAQWAQWRKPYFRFTRDSKQHAVLRRFERNLGDEALVRYASPAFWMRGELEAAQLAGQVLEQTGFVSPGVFGRHRVWTYVSPGTAGRTNAGGREAPFELFRTVFNNYAEADRPTTELELANPLRRHLRRVASVAREREPTTRSMVDEWTRSLRDDLPGEVVLDLRDVATIVSVAAAVGTNWWLVGETDR